MAPAEKGRITEAVIATEENLHIRPMTAGKGHEEFEDGSCVFGSIDLALSEVGNQGKTAKNAYNDK